MATNKFIEKDSIFKVNTYTIDTHLKKILGKGAYGIVYRATDTHGKEIAAKTIDGKKHPRILMQDVNRLLHLDHQNIVKIFDFNKKDETFWMFMEFCCYGDLNDFFHKTKLQMKENLEIMKGLAGGINYLHCQNIIHRDIKPANILIACTSPVVPKLTDFDLSKSLDPDYETSVMSSNVGTNAFKAPEFFNRVGGKLRYHRNVDIYAAGLTFLTLIQGREKSKQLIPQIETPRDESELHVQSIGQLIAERIKYKVQELNIVRIVLARPESGTKSDDEKQEEELKKEVRKVIKRMTCVDPTERLTAVEVLHFLEQV